MPKKAKTTNTRRLAGVCCGAWENRTPDIFLATDTALYQRRAPTTNRYRNGHKSKEPRPGGLGFLDSIVEPGRIELPTSCLPQTQRSTNEEPQPPTATAMATKAKNPGPEAWVSLIPLWSLGESNSRHLACKASALPTELRPRNPP